MMVRLRLVFSVVRLIMMLMVRMVEFWIWVRLVRMVKYMVFFWNFE